MAKLLGVKVIDMANGEVTKIAYNGEEYAKVEDTPKTDDVVKMTRDCTIGDYEEGDYFLATGDCEFIDNVGDSRDYRHSPCVFNTFRKISAPDLTERMDSVEQRVSALEESATQAEVIEGEPKVGDKIRIVDVHPLSARYYDKGDIFTVSRVHPKTSSHRLYVKVKETNENIFREEFEIIERPGCNPESTKRKLNSDLAPGTLVRFNDGILTIKERRPQCDDMIGAGKAYTFTSNGWLCESDFEVLTDEEAEEHKEIARWAKIDRKPNEIKNGDIVRVIKDVDGHPVGTIGERVNGDMVEANGKRYYHTKGIELITPVEHRFDK